MRLPAPLLVRCFSLGLLAAVAGLGCHAKTNAPGINSGNVYVSCTSSCTDLQFDNNLHATDAFVTISTSGHAAEDFGPLKTNGQVTIVSTDVSTGQVFTISSGTGTGAGAVRGAPVTCSVGNSMLPANDGFGEILVTITSSTSTYLTSCTTGWQ